MSRLEHDDYRISPYRFCNDALTNVCGLSESGIVEVAALLRDDEGRITGYHRVEEGKTDSLYYNRLWIDQSQCVRCGQCEAVCPVNAISIQKVSLEMQLSS